MDQQRPSSDEGDGKRSSADQSNFRFTFNLSATTSGKSSFIEPDPSLNDLKESSESLSDSVQNFPEEFGRTFHAYRAGSYAFPNDLPERERLALQNEALVRAFGGRLYFAPLSKHHYPRTILDIATGMGEWAIQMGDAFPNAEVIATDLSPIQPDEVPPNVNFYVEDSSEAWDYSHRFDYIHTRVTGGCWSSFSAQVLDQAFEYLEPGGYFEAQEVGTAFRSDDGTLDPNGAMARWVRDLEQASVLVDRPLHFANNMKPLLEAAGFVDVQERVFKMPTNAWAKDEEYKEIGRMWERNFSSGLSGFSVSLFNRAFDRTPAETEVSLVEVRRELSNPRVHAYLPMHVVWGRKPYPGEGGGPQKPLFQSS